MPVECSPQNEPRGYRSFELKCSCGRGFYMVVSTEVPGLFALSTDPQEAVLTLLREQARTFQSPGLQAGEDSSPP